MNREEMKQFYVKAVKTFLHASLFSPLVLAGAFYFPYIVPKTVFFQVAVECALFFYILLIALDKSYAPKFDTLTKAALVFFGVYVLAGALGANPARSFFGTYERMLSVVNFAHFIVFFLIAKSVLTQGRDWLLFFRTFVIVSVLVSLYGVGQKLGLPAFYHTDIDRIDSIIGNAAFLAGYLMFALFFAILLLVKDSNPSFRALYVFSAVLNLAVFYLTGTRGAALGLAVGAIFLFCAYIFRPSRADAAVEKKYLAWGLVALALAAGAIILLEKKSGGISQSLKRFTSVSFSDTTVQTRLLSARTSWEGFLARPVLGWGPENYHLVFDKYYNPKLYPAENWFDHAHNIFFDIVTTTGAVGFAAYFFFLGYLMYMIVRGARAGVSEYWPRMLCAALLAAYFTQNIFVFDSLATYLPFFMLCAYAAAGNPRTQRAEQSSYDGNPRTQRAEQSSYDGFPLSRDAAAREKKEKIFSNPIPKIAIWLVPLFLAGTYWINVRPLSAAHYAVLALQTDKTESRIAQGYFETAIALSNFGKHEIRGKLADFAGEALAQNKDEEAKKEIARYALAEMEKNLNEDPLNFRGYLYLAGYLSNNYAALASYGVDPLARADQVLARAEALGSRKPVLYIQWGKVKLLEGKRAEAIGLFERAVRLNPDATDSQLRLASAYRDDKQNDRAIAIYEEVFSRGNDLGVSAYIDLAVGFANLGKGEEAIAAAQKVAELDPSLKAESERFISDARARLLK
ncbi:O-antigen ligase family protein [Candidatus Azambacteria bacterium]|nr:O-antigen ligase family protein [Candidatus Azambacteria bacterium]MBI3685577.1 O-antigen ligase family protein [Candidatus Azambacteria bacterium]